MFASALLHIAITDSSLIRIINMERPSSVNFTDIEIDVLRKVMRHVEISGDSFVKDDRYILASRPKNMSVDEWNAFLSKIGKECNSIRR